MVRPDVRELFEAVFGDDPAWFAEADRIEQLVSNGLLEDAGIAVSHLLFERQLGQKRNGIDLAIMRSATVLLDAYVERRAVEEIELTLGALEKLVGPGLDRRAVELGATRMPELAGALAHVDGGLARRASALAETCRASRGRGSRA